MKFKKSQMTIFMVIGLLIILGGVLFFYTTKEAQTKLEPEIKIVDEQVPIEFDPIKKYASDCVYSVSVEGLQIIGKQGGHISLTDKSLSREPFSATQNPTESDAVFFAKGSDLAVPYWWYLKSPNNCRGDCKFASKRPELRQSDNSIEKQLERYIDIKLKECLNNFEPFAEQGFKISEEGSLRTDVTIASEDVIVLAEYPLNVESQGSKTKMTQFIANIPINLERVYELATKITNMEMNHRYLEKHILNLMVGFSGTSKEKLPPMSDIQFGVGGATTWQKRNVKEKVTEVLAAYVPLFQVDGTYNYERNLFGSELKQRLYDSTIIPVANSSFTNLAAYFAYLDFWPVYFDLNCDGEKCAPSSTNTLIPFFGIQNYKFAYDLSFPVLVEVKDPFALNGQGYAFNFFLEGNIRNNKPMPAGFQPLEMMLLSERSLLCDARTSGDVNVGVADSAAKKPVSDAQIYYTITGESCFIGSTNEQGSLTEKFPVAVGGAVSAVKDGYIGKAVEFDAEAGKDARLEVGLQPIHTKKIIVKKKNIVKTAQGWKLANTPVDLSSKEAVTLTLTRINGDGELDFSSAVNYIGMQNEIIEADIAPGSYTADAILTLNERIIIPERQKCISKGIGGSECFTIPKIDFGDKSTAGYEQFPEGGLNLNLTISADAIIHDTIVFYVLSIDIAGIPEQQRVAEDTEQLSKIEEYSNVYQVALQPAFQ